MTKNRLFAIFSILVLMILLIPFTPTRSIHAATRTQTPLETITVPVDGSWVQSTAILGRGVPYTIRASGTFVVGGPGYGDAEYAFTADLSFVENNADFDDPTSVDLGIGINDVTNSSKKNPFWGTFDPSHVYTTTVIGSDEPLTFNYHDTFYGDNSGSLTVEILTTPTYSISGQVTLGGTAPLSGVTISDGVGDTATTDDSGNYTLSNLAAGTYTLTPSLSGYTFSPPSIPINLQSDLTGQNFVANHPQIVSISGIATFGGGITPAVGVTVSDGAGQTAVTDSSGIYQFLNLAPGTYTLQATKEGYGFLPLTRTVVLPSFLTQVKGVDFDAYYKQDKGLWTGDYLAGASSCGSIAGAGCAVTAAADVLAAYSIPVNGAIANPGNLNKWLTPNGFNDCNLDWFSLQGLTKSLVQRWWPWKSSLDARLAAIDQALQDGELPIITVHPGNDTASANGLHFVVITGHASTGISNDYIIQIP